MDISQGKNHKSLHNADKSVDEIMVNNFVIFKTTDR